MRPGDTGHADSGFNRTCPPDLPPHGVTEVTLFGPSRPGYLITVTDQPSAREVDALLDELYVGLERVSQAEIYRRAVAAELPADLLATISAMPQGEYAIDEAAELLGGSPR
jgi:hypothetical protein